MLQDSCNCYLTTPFCMLGGDETGLCPEKHLVWGTSSTAHYSQPATLLYQSRPLPGTANTPKQASWGDINKGTIYSSVHRVRETNKGWCIALDLVTVGAAGTTSAADILSTIYRWENWSGVSHPGGPREAQRRKHRGQHLENWNSLNVLLHHSHLLASTTSSPCCPLDFCLLFFKQNMLRGFKQGSLHSRGFHWPPFHHLGAHICCLCLPRVHSPFSRPYLSFLLENELGGPSAPIELTIFPEP